MTLNKEWLDQIITGKLVRKTETENIPNLICKQFQLILGALQSQVSVFFKAAFWKF